MASVIQQQSVVIAQAPAKIIISGEHSVIYNQTAVSCAIKKYTSVSVSANNLSLLIIKDQIFTLKKLKDMHLQVKTKYQQYLLGNLAISRVFTNSDQFLPVAIYEMLQLLKYDYSHGLTITVSSIVPIGAGMGSSSTLLAACLHALAKYLEVNLSTAAIYTYAKNIENFQHGKSSGLDLYTTLSGGIICKVDDIYRQLAIKHLPLYFVNTGQPLSTTGECVAFVKNKFNDLKLLADFTSISNFIANALQNNQIADLLPAITENHRLLQKIGLVSQSVARFIDELNNMHTSAKICGAGTVLGENNGIVLICSLELDFARVLAIVKKYGYQLQNVEIDTDGTKVV